jgi:glycosyltransferase involved in cell wall biosynthesis
VNKGSQLITVLMPVYNEEKVLPTSLDRLDEVVASVDYDCELILVDDGSTDESWELIQQASMDNASVTGVKLSRNFGQQSAISAGLKNSSGDAVIVLDADLQNPPELITEFLEKWESGYDVVYGVFKSRSDPFLKRIFVKFFYDFWLNLTNISIPKNAADFSLMSRQVVDEINQLPERQKFIRGLRAWVGFNQTGVTYDKPDREKGESKYTYGKLLQLAIDGILSFSSFPLRLAIFMGIIISVLGFIYNGYIIFNKLLYQAPRGWTSLASLEVILSGIQLLTLGIIGEYLGRVYEETKQRPEFIVEDTVRRAEDGR